MRHTTPAVIPTKLFALPPYSRVLQTHPRIPAALWLVLIPILAGNPVEISAVISPLPRPCKTPSCPFGDVISCDFCEITNLTCPTSIGRGCQKHRINTDAWILFTMPESYPNTTALRSNSPESFYIIIIMPPPPKRGH